MHLIKEHAILLLLRMTFFCQHAQCHTLLSTRSSFQHSTRQCFLIACAAGLCRWQHVSTVRCIRGQHHIHGIASSNRLHGPRKSISAVTERWETRSTADAKISVSPKRIRTCSKEIIPQGGAWQHDVASAGPWLERIYCVGTNTVITLGLFG